MKIFNKGEDKFIQEFDAVHYAKSIRNLNTLMAAMLDDSEKFMVKYQKSSLISLESSESESSNESDENDIPKLYSNVNRKAKHKIKIDEFIVRLLLTSFRNNIREKNGRNMTINYWME